MWQKNRSILNARFLEIVALSDIPRLHVLLQVCSKKGKCLGSIIGRIEDALNNKYKPKKYGEVDWDKALLAIRIGGPRLLHVLHITDGYPALRSVQKKNKDLSPNLVAAVDTT